MTGTPRPRPPAAVAARAVEARAAEAGRWLELE
jgi:hypothetical protein